MKPFYFVVVELATHKIVTWGNVMAENMESAKNEITPLDGFRVYFAEME